MQTAKHPPLRVFPQRSQVGGLGGGDNPTRGERKTLVAGGVVFLDASVEPRCGEVFSEDRFEVDELVGDVEDQQAVWCKLAQVDRESLGCEEMERDRIRTKGVLDQDIDAVIGKRACSCAGIDQTDVDLCGALGEIAKEASVLGDLRDFWIDLKKGEGVARSAVGCECSDPKAKDTEVARWRGALCLKKLTEWALV